jgi:DNA invertase Pin-like site-specific DNA recombinase
MTKGSIRAASYQRVSTALQATEGLSLAEQERRLAEYVEGQGWQHVGTYTDAGISGKREDRPQLQRLLADLDSIDRLVIVKLDRIGRSARHLLELFDRLESAGVELVSLNDNIDTSTATGRMLPKLLAVLAE